MVTDPDDAAVRESAGVRSSEFASRDPGQPTGHPRDQWARFGWLLAVVWLLFLTYPILALLESRAASTWVVAGWAALVAFAVLYVVGFTTGMHRNPGVGGSVARRQWVTFGALILCAVVSVPAEGRAALTFLPFLMGFASYRLNRQWHWIAYAVSLFIVIVCVFAIPGGRTYLTLMMIVVLLGVVNTVSIWLIGRSIEAERLGIELATSEGREAVARDVHDLIGHSLTVVGLKAQLVRKLMDADPQRAKAELADIEALTADAIASVRATVAGQRSTSLAEQLASTRAALEAGDIGLTVTGAPEALSAAQALTASWILREATTNVLRHANATAVEVRILPGRVIVIDNGAGPSSEVHDGNGVRGMRERAAAAGAAFSFGTAQSGGTRVEVTW